MPDPQRDELAAGIQKAFAEHEDGALLVGWFLVAELRRPDGRPYLAYRTGNVNGDGLTSWQALGYLHSAVEAVNEQSRADTIPRDEDPSGGDDADPA